MRIVAGLLLLIISTFSGRAAFAQQVVKITTSEWPPYTTESLAGQGASSVIVTKAFALAGYTVKIEFYPFERAVKIAAEDPTYAGYMTEYYDTEVLKHFIYSGVIGTSPLGFVEQKAAPVSWTSLDDLKGKRIGVVNGYVNTASFDDMMRRNVLQTEGVDDDVTNLRKLLVGHLDLAVIDQNVLDYLLATSNKGAALQFNAHLLENKNLYIAFRRDSKIDPVRAAFDKGLAQIDPAKMQNDYFGTAFPK